MRYAVYADLSSQLTGQQRTTLFEALDIVVPGSGCVGPDRRSNDEVYFSIDAQSADEAREQSSRYMEILLQKAGLVGTVYTIELQAMARA